MYFRLFPSSMCSLSLATLKHTHTLLHQQALNGDLIDVMATFEYKQDLSRTQKAEFTKKLTKATELVREAPDIFDRLRQHRFEPSQIEEDKAKRGNDKFKNTKQPATWMVRLTSKPTMCECECVDVTSAHI